MKHDHLLLWVDLETSGLDLDACSILEVGWMLTNLAMEPLTDPVNVYPYTWEPRESFIRDEEADEFVRQMHTASGLWNARNDAAERGLIVSPKEIQRRIIQDCRDHLAEGGSVTVAGGGVSTFDMPLLRRDYPDVVDKVTYYTMDVSQIERYLQLCTGAMRGSSKSAIHRVIPDIRHSLKVGQTIRRHLPPEVIQKILEALTP